MAIAKKGSRKIEIDGVAYRWVIRGKPTYSQAINESNLSAVVELFENPASKLVIDFLKPRSDSWLTPSKTEIGPSHIESSIRKAITLGWQPTKKGVNLEVQQSTV